MALSSAIVTRWVLETFKSPDWKSLQEVVKDAIRLNTPMGEDLVSENAENLVLFVAQELFNLLQSDEDHGRVSIFELDEESPPYIKCTVPASTYEVLRRLKDMTPTEFESVCANLLNALGAQSQQQGGSQDGGIDFIGYGLCLNPALDSMPSKSKLVVLGQAKRYASSNSVKLNEVRQFVGAAKKKHNDLIVSERISALSPVVYALWTTSVFDRPASEYGLGLGLWLIDSLQLASYVERFSLLPELVPN